MPKHIRFSLNRSAGPTTPDGSPLARYGILDGGAVYETDGLWNHERGDDFEFNSVRLLPPTWPSKIVCVGRNYVDHAKELGNPVPSEPLIFLKPSSSLIASGDNIVYPAITQSVSYEGELAVIVGRQARHVGRHEAWRYVFGYTCLNDVTARDLQKKDGQWTRGKGFDTFCPCGPWIVPAGDVDLAATRVRTYINGDLKQDSPISDMIFPIDVIIAYITEFMTLEPGDLIATGTPPGVGPLSPGDVVRVEINGVGALQNTVCGGAAE